MAFGAVLLDVVYATQIPVTSPLVRTEVSDILLVVAGLTVFAAIGAIAASWGRKTARYLFVASLAVVMVGLQTPALLSGIIRDADSALGVRVGP